MGLERRRCGRKLGGKIGYHVMRSRLEFRGRKDVDGSIHLGYASDMPSSDHIPRDNFDRLNGHLVVSHATIT